MYEKPILAITPFICYPITGVLRYGLADIAVAIFLVRDQWLHLVAIRLIRVGLLLHQGHKRDACTTLHKA